jgi:hypothetical protein
VSTLNWQKSSYSNEGADCLNVATAADGTVRIRESDAPGVILTVTPAALRSLLLAVKAGEFDRSVS